MDKNREASGGFGEHLFSSAVLGALVGGAFNAVFVVGMSPGPLKVPMSEFGWMVGGAYFVLAALWHRRRVMSFRRVLSTVMLLLVLAFWWNRNSETLKAFYAEPHKSVLSQKTQPELQPEPKPKPQSGTDAQRRSASNDTGAGAGPRDQSVASAKPSPVPPIQRDVYRKGVTVNVSARGVDSLLAANVRGIVTDRVGAVQALQDAYVKVEVDDLYMSDQEGPMGRGFGSTKAYAVVRLAAYATDSGKRLHSVQGDGASPVYFQGQAKPVDTMKKEALSDALESAFRQIP